MFYTCTRWGLPHTCLAARARDVAIGSRVSFRDPRNHVTTPPHFSPLVLARGQNFHCLCGTFRQEVFAGAVSGLPQTARRLYPAECLAVSQHHDCHALPRGGCPDFPPCCVALRQAASGTHPVSVVRVFNHVSNEKSMANLKKITRTSYYQCGAVATRTRREFKIQNSRSSSSQDSSLT